jgi:hypothetical protein
MVEHQTVEEPTEHPSVKHEGSDASLGWVLIFAGLMIVSAILIHLALWLLLLRYLRVGPEAKVQVSVPAAREPGHVPPAPRLEGMERYFQPRLGEAPPAKIEEEPGRLERREGTVRIPVELAMEILANKLPSQTPKDGVRMGREPPFGSNSGRIPWRQEP